MSEGVKNNNNRFIWWFKITKNAS